MSVDLASLAAVPSWVRMLASVVALALVAFAVIYQVAFRKPMAPIDRARRRADRLTYAAAVIGTAAMAEGMWGYFRDELAFSGAVLYAVFAFFEIATIVSGIRAKINLRESAARHADDPSVHVSPGRDGLAVYVLAGVSGLLAASHEHTFLAALGRIAIAAAASWLWHRSLAVLREHLTGTPRRRINWRWTPERLLVRAGLAEATGRDVSSVDRARRLAAISRAAYRLHTFRETGARPWRQRRAERRLRRHLLAGAGHLDLAADDAVRSAVREHLAVLYGAVWGTSPAALRDLDPWRLADMPPDTITAPPAQPGVPATGGGAEDPPGDSADGAGSGVRMAPERAALVARALAAQHPDMPLDTIGEIVDRSERQIKRYLDMPALAGANGRSSS